MSFLDFYRATLQHLGGEEALEARALKHAAQNLVMAPAALVASGPAPAAAAAAVSPSSTSSGHGPGMGPGREATAAHAGASGGGGGPPGGSGAAVAAVYSAREKLLQAGLRACGGLHPAFEEPDGHYRALRDIADALVGGLAGRAGGLRGWLGRIPLGSWVGLGLVTWV
jgi:hypothetical protein